MERRVSIGRMLAAALFAGAALPEYRPAATNSRGPVRHRRGHVSRGKKKAQHGSPFKVSRIKGTIVARPRHASSAEHLLVALLAARAA